MRYSMKEIAGMIRHPGDQSQYTDELLREVIRHLYTPEQHAAVIDLLEPIKDQYLRVKIAAVHASEDPKHPGKGSLDRLRHNVNLALVDYRDLLMHFYA